MNFNEYQKKAHETAQYPENLFDISQWGWNGIVNVESKTTPKLNWIYPALGLAGESGKLLNKLKKIIRDKNGQIDLETREQLRSELGDILWYVSELAGVLDCDLDMIARNNIGKLALRALENKIKGSGDNR